jgi:hypothetical protein
MKEFKIKCPFETWANSQEARKYSDLQRNAKPDILTDLDKQEIVKIIFTDCIKYRYLTIKN